MSDRPEPPDLFQMLCKLVLDLIFWGAIAVLMIFAISAFICMCSGQMS